MDKSLIFEVGMKYTWALLLSLFFHFFMVLWLARQPSGTFLRPASPFEVELVDKTEESQNMKKRTIDQSAHHRQVVRKTLVPEKMLRPDDESIAKFLSEKRQRVEKEIRALKNGPTQNSVSDKRAPTPQDQKSEEIFNQNIVRKNKGETNRQSQSKSQSTKNSNSRSRIRLDSQSPVERDSFLIAENQVQNERKADNFNKPYVRDSQGGGAGPSTLGDMMPQEMSVGSLTAVNTDRFLYYSFYARIEDLVRFRWESKVRSAVALFDPFFFRNVVRDRDWSTDIEFWLMPDGRLHSAHILKESGVKNFDGAAVMAFKEAGVFPNPPAEMKEEDGFVRVRFVFNVRLSGSGSTQ